MNTIKILISLALSSLILEGCSTMKVKPLTTGSTDSCAQHAQKDGVAVGIRPLTDPREVKDMFNINLLNKGLLPILVVVENQTVADSFVITKDRVFVLNESTGTASTSQIKNVTASKTAAGETIALVFAGGLLSLEGAKLASDATVIQYNLADKEFYTRTLGPGGKAQGFVYFQFSKDRPPSGDHHIVVQLKNSATGKETTFDFPVSLKSTK